jgi:arylsulfatase
MVLVAQKYSTDAPARLLSPWIINLTVDPKEREPFTLPYVHSWTASHFNELVGAFRASVQREPLIPAGAPLDYVPAAGRARDRAGCSNSRWRRLPPLATTRTNAACSPQTV